MHVYTTAKMWRSGVKLRCYPPCFDQGDSSWYTPLQTARLLPRRPWGTLLSLYLPSHCQSSGLQAHCVPHVPESQSGAHAWQALNSLGCLLSQKTVSYLYFLFLKTLVLSTERFGLFFLADIKYSFIFMGIINFNNSIHAHNAFRSNQGE